MEEIMNKWNRYLSEAKKGSKQMEIVISGAFPDSDEIYKQSLMDALILFSKSIIRNGYELTFGAHPTFQELFYEVVKNMEPQDYKNKLNMYISRWFLVDNSEKEYEDKYDLHISKKKETLALSLTEMRRNMIQRKNVKALVCLGGKIKQNKSEEGIREEIKLAREWNIPVFIVGSVGGCSSEVALEYKHNGWEGINNAPEELNKAFLEGIDYFNMAQEMLSYISSNEKK